MYTEREREERVTVHGMCLCVRVGSGQVSKKVQYTSVALPWVFKYLMPCITSTHFEIMDYSLYMYIQHACGHD